MTGWLRLLKVLVLARVRPRLAWTDESRLEFRVWPGDLDVNVHMNNARYLAVMDMGRADLILRSGIWRLVRRRRLQPVVASALVRWRRSLRPFERFTLRTRIVGWDAKWLFIEHRVDRGDELVCHAVVKGLFRTAGGTVPSAELAAFLGAPAQSPPLPAWVADWLALDAARRSE